MAWLVNSFALDHARFGNLVHARIRPNKWRAIRSISRQKTNGAAMSCSPRVPLRTPFPKCRRLYELRACCVGYQFWKIRDDPRGSDCLGDYRRSVPQIRLFLSTIREQCSQNGDEFSKLVVTTYLHELGHHLGNGGKSLGNLGIVEQMPRTTWSSLAVSVGRSEVRLRTSLEKDSWSERFAAFSNSSASTSIAVVFVGIY